MVNLDVLKIACVLNVLFCWLLLCLYTVFLYAHKNRMVDSRCFTTEVLLQIVFFEAKKKMVRLLCGVSLREVVKLVDVAMANYKKKGSSWRFDRITGTIFGSFIITNPARLMVKMFKTSQLSSRIAPPGLTLNSPCWSRHHLSRRIWAMNNKIPGLFRVLC